MIQNPIIIKRDGTPEGLRTITVAADPPEGGEVSGGGVVSDGITITLTVGVAEGYSFSGWQENGETVSEDSSYTFTVTQDRALTAVFSEAPSIKLPEGYVLVSYIRPTVYSSFDNTQANVNTGAIFLAGYRKDFFMDRIEMDVEVLDSIFENASSYRSQECLIGNKYQYYYANTSGSPTSKNYYNILGLQVKSGVLGLYLNDVGGYGKAIATLSGAGIHTYIFDGPKKTFQEDDTLTANIAYTATTTSLLSPCVLGISSQWSGRPSSSVSVRTYNGYGIGTCIDIRLRQLRVYESTADSTGELIHHMYPVKNISTGEGALYDVVTETLYTSTKPTELEVGPEL